MMYFKILFVSILFVFVSCDDKEELHFNQQIPQTVVDTTTYTGNRKDISYEESLQEWELLKQTNGNSYIYTTSTHSWIGHSSTTEIIVKNGQVIGRNYKDQLAHYHPDFDDFIPTIYTETADDLGTNRYGAAPATIDDLYQTCLADYLKFDTTHKIIDDNGENISLTVIDNNKTIYFSTINNKVIGECGYVDNRCADDCYIGISINQFKWQ